jgi:hypothetical protein
LETIDVDDLSMSALWTVAAVVFGFQSAALSWRITREIEMEARGELTWVTIPDGVVVLSILFLIGGVYIAPILANLLTLEDRTKHPGGGLAYCNV